MAVITVSLDNILPASIIVKQHQWTVTLQPPHPVKPEFITVQIQRELNGMKIWKALCINSLKEQSAASES